MCSHCEKIDQLLQCLCGPWVRLVGTVTIGYCGNEWDDVLVVNFGFDFVTYKELGKKGTPGFVNFVAGDIPTTGFACVIHATLSSPFIQALSFFWYLQWCHNIRFSRYIAQF